ncbi:MAG: DUF4097 family beta strand repeat-containing protein [Candidatus Hydrogenedentota bacterium]
MKTYLKSILLAGILAVLVLLFAIHSVAPSLPRVVGQPAVEETRSFSWPGSQRFVLVNRDGAVRVSAHEAEEIVVDATVRIYLIKKGESAVAHDYADSLFEVTAEKDRIKVVTEPGERPDLLEMRVECEVFVPSGTDVRVNSANGNVYVAGGCGAVEIQGHNADIFVRKPAGMVTARTTNGRINIMDAPEGALLETVNGNIYAHMRGGAIDADTTNGAIVAHVLDTEVDRAELNSMNGGITLVLDERCSAFVDARTMHGGIRSDFPIDTSSGVKRRHHLRGGIGSGRTELHMQTLNGNIWLARRR